MHAYVLSLRKLFKQNEKPEQAISMKKYMRDQFEYLGIKAPQSAALMKVFIKENGLPPIAQLDEITHDLWSLPQREFQYAAMSLISKLEKKVEPDTLTQLNFE
jgi:3-methyladenine DNA glycosylase AlkD